MREVVSMNWYKKGTSIHEQLCSLNELGINFNIHVILDDFLVFLKNDDMDPFLLLLI